MTESEEHTRHHPSEDKPLSESILRLIEEQKGEDLTQVDFRLYDDINPDALNNLFREEARGETKVQFYVDDVEVSLWGDGAIDIRVTPQEDEE